MQVFAIVPAVPPSKKFIAKFFGLLGRVLVVFCGDVGLVFFIFSLRFLKSTRSLEIILCLYRWFWGG